MELKTLWLGLVISMAAFAVKTGLGWAYLWRSGQIRKRLASSLGIFALYAAVFAAVALLVSKINLLAHYETLRPLWQNGVTLHWLTAVMLFIWGLVLLRRPVESCGHRRSRGWLMLVIPCPVCLCVILMSVAALNLYFPEQAVQSTAGLFAAFMVIAALGALAVSVKPRRADASAESALGLAMLMMAAYFMLSALIAPQFTELGRVYRISAHAADGRAAQLWPTVHTVGATFALLAAGFFSTRRRLGRQQ